MPVPIGGCDGGDANKQHCSSNTDALVTIIKRCELEDAPVILSKYMCIPLLFAQMEANRSQCEHDKGMYVLRQARTYISKMRAQRARAKEAYEEEMAKQESIEATGWTEVPSKSKASKLKQAKKKTVDHSMQNRGYVQCAAPYFFANACNDKQGMVLRSPTGVCAAQVGYIMNVVTQGIVHDGANDVLAIDGGYGGVCFSNEPPCKCCGIVPTNMATCLLGARRGLSSMECLQNALADFVEIITVHEGRFREDLDVGSTAWSNCAACGGGNGGNGGNVKESVCYYFGSVAEAGDALSKCFTALQHRHGEDNVLAVFDAVTQHRLRDCIDIQIDAEHAKLVADAQAKQGWNVSSVLEQIGPLAEVVCSRPAVSLEDELRSKAEYKARVEAETGRPVSEEIQEMLDAPIPPTPRDQKRIKLLEPVRLEYYNADCVLQTTYHEAGEIIEFPTDAATPGTRMVVLDDVVGRAAVTDVNLRRRTVAEVGDIVRVSLHHRSSVVDEHRLPKHKLVFLREIGVLETDEELPKLIANMVVPTNIDEYKVWQERALDSYAKLELLEVVTAPLPPCVRAARERLRQQAAPRDAELVHHMQQLHTRGAPRIAALPLLELRHVERGLRRSYCKSIEQYRDLADKDQSLQLYVIDRWIQQYRDRHGSSSSSSGDAIPEQKILNHIYQVLTVQYIHGCAKYSDLDKYVIPLKLRMGVSIGVSYTGGRFRSVHERKEWKSLGIRGEEVTEEAERKLCGFVRDKYDRLKGEGPWR